MNAKYKMTDKEIAHWDVAAELIKKPPYYVSYEDDEGRLVQEHLNGRIEHIQYNKETGEFEVIEVLCQGESVIG